MSISIVQSKNGYAGLGQAQTSEKRDARELQLLLVKACTMTPEQVDGLWSKTSSGTSRQALLAAASKYKAKINAMVGKSPSAKVYNWAVPWPGTGLKKVKVSPAGFIARLEKAILEDPQSCGERPPVPPVVGPTFDPTGRPTVFDPTVPATQPISTEASFCRIVINQYIPATLASIDQQAIGLVKIFGDYKKGTPGTKKLLVEYIDWFDKTGVPATKKLASSAKACARADLETQVLNKLRMLQEGVDNVRTAISGCKVLVETAKNQRSIANKVKTDLKRAVRKKQWGKVAKLRNVIKQIIPVLRGLRERLKEAGCGEDGPRWRRRLRQTIINLKSALKEARDARRAWLAKQKEEERPPVVVPEEEEVPIPVEEEEEIVPPEEEVIPVEEEEEEEEGLLVQLFQNPWPWILGGAALVFGVVAVTTAAERKKTEARLPATAGYGKYRRH